MCILHLRQEDVRTDLRVVGLTASDRVNRLDGDPGGLEELGRVGMGSRDVRGEAGALVEPVGLAEFTNDTAVGSEVAENAVAHVADGVG